MYIQPYEPQQGSFTSAPFGRRSFGEALQQPDMSSPDPLLGSDGVTQSPPWSQMLSDAGDPAGALADGPLSFGLGGMLSSLTSMMQQLAQMIQTLVERASGGGEPGAQQNPVQMHGHRHSHAMAGDGMAGSCGCGCTQQAQGDQGP